MELESARKSSFSRRKLYQAFQTDLFRPTQKKYPDIRPHEPTQIQDNEELSLQWAQLQNLQKAEVLKKHCQPKHIVDLNATLSQQILQRKKKGN